MVAGRALVREELWNKMESRTSGIRREIVRSVPPLTQDIEFRLGLETKGHRDTGAKNGKGRL